MPNPLSIAWVSNLPELQNAYLESPTPLMWWVCCGNKSGLYQGGDQEAGKDRGDAGSAELPQLWSRYLTVTWHPGLGSTQVPQEQFALGFFLAPADNKNGGDWGRNVNILVVSECVFTGS